MENTQVVEILCYLLMGSCWVSVIATAPHSGQLTRRGQLTVFQIVAPNWKDIRVCSIDLRRLRRKNTWLEILTLLLTACKKPGKINYLTSLNLRVYINKDHLEFPLWLSWLKTWRSVCEDVGLISGLAEWIKLLVLLKLWCRPMAAAPIRPLAWELPYVAGAAMKKGTLVSSSL